LGKLPHEKTAVKLHTLLDLRASIPSFIDFSDGKSTTPKQSNHYYLS
jgi:hypothetical protein